MQLMGQKQRNAYILVYMYNVLGSRYYVSVVTSVIV